MDALDQIKAIDIRDLLPSGAELKNNVCCCPLPDHSEKTGSFRYHPSNNSFFCWGCRRGGSTIDFWMHLTGLGLAEAIRDLADRHRITLEKWTPEQEQRLERARRMEEARAYAADLYARQLENTPTVLAYLTGRGLTLDTIRELRLGFAHKQLLAAVKGDKTLADRGITIEDFEAAGLIRPEGVDKEGRKRPQQDYFRDRITWPVIVRGRLVQMAGRALPASIAGHDIEPKYLNLPGDLGVLFLEGNIGKKTFVSEGLPDTTLLHQWGVPVVGQLGTGGAEKQAAKFRKCEVVWLCFDNDPSGRASADRTARAIHLALEAGEVRLLFPPGDAKDWNDWALAGGTIEAFRELAKAAPPLLDFLIDAIPADVGPIEKDRHIKAIAALLVKQGASVRDHYIKRLKTATGLRVRDLEAMVDAAAGTEKDAAKAADDGAAVVLFETVTEIIPAQDYAFNSPARGNMATFLPVQRTTTDKDGNAKKVRKVEPVLITVTHTAEASPAIKWAPCKDLGLSEAEKRRVPNETGVRGRWRPDEKFPFSISHFVRGDVKSVDGYKLYQDILGIFRQHVVFPSPADAEVLALFAMGTYVYQLFEAFPYVHLHGIRESGKSDVGRILEETCFNAFMAASQTQSTVVRSAEMNCRTQIVDEAERLNNPDPKSADHELMLIANSGYKRGAKAEKSEWDDVMKQHRPTPFDIYTPKVFASIAQLNYVLASRCIIIPCLRAKQEELEQAQVVSLSQAMHWQAANLADIRDRLYCWALLNFPAVRDAYAKHMIESPSLRHLKGRERELWLPLLTLAFCLDNWRAGGDQTELARLRDDGDLITLRMIEHQRGKEHARRLVEAESSIEVATLKAVYEVVTNGELAPERMDLIKGPIYKISLLAELVTEQLRDIGVIRPDRSMGGRWLTELLRKTAAIDDEAAFKAKVNGEAIRVVAVNKDRVRDSVGRLGGSITEAEVA